MSCEDEEPWLRRMIIRLRPVLRVGKDPRTLLLVKEFIAEAEDRLEILEGKKKLAPMRPAHKRDRTDKDGIS